MSDQLPDLLYSDVEEQLRASVRSLLARRAEPNAVLVRTESEQTTDGELWRALAVELGCAGLAVPEEYGGAGASWREAAVVAEELGRAVAPVPFLGSAVIATGVLLSAGEKELLPRLAAGQATAALALPLGTGPRAPVGAGVRADGGALTGTVPAVADALIADTVLVLAGERLYTVDASAAGVVRTPVVSLDMTRQLCELTFDAAPGTLLAEGPVAVAAVERGLALGAVLLASEQLGLAERCLEMTVEYLGQRRQFGRLIGSYQALKHRLADLWVQLTQARAVARYAAACAATDAVSGGDGDLPVAAALAQAHCSPVAQLAAEECLQMHGGIGFTWEHPAHLYLKRAKSAALALGTADMHRGRLAELVDLPA